MKLQSIEPFPKYPESVIDSKEKSIKVINQNYYYFIVMGFYFVALGYATYISGGQDREILISSVTTSSIGAIYIILSSIAKIFKIRLAAILLFVFIVAFFIGDLILIGTAAIDFYFLFKFILAWAAYRIIISLTYYNKLKL